MSDVRPLKMTELLTRCAACSAEFLVSGNRAHPSPLRELLIGKSKSIDELLGQSALVRCPECGNAFPSNDVFFLASSARVERASCCFCLSQGLQRSLSTSQ